MIKAIEILPFDNELQSHYADRLGVVYAKTVSIQQKKDNGQFFTPTEIAQFMAGLTKQTQDKLKILDPGCGTAILSSSMIESLIKQNDNLKEIELVVYETDKDILPFTQATHDYLKKWLKKSKINFKATLDTNDFVLENKECFEPSVHLECYDLAFEQKSYKLAN